MFKKFYENRDKTIVIRQYRDEIIRLRDDCAELEEKFKLAFDANDAWAKKEITQTRTIADLTIANDKQRKTIKVLQDRLHDLEAEHVCLSIDEFEALEKRFQNVEEWVLECSKVNAYHAATLREVTKLSRTFDLRGAHHSLDAIAVYLKERQRGIVPVQLPGTGETTQVMTHQQDTKEQRLFDELTEVKAVRDKAIASIEILKAQLKANAELFRSSLDPRPRTCRFRLMAENQDYPITGCRFCGGSPEQGYPLECWPIDPATGKPPFFKSRRSGDAINEKG